MRKELTIHGEALGASQQGTLAVEQFLKDNYLFRFNILSGKVECVTLPSDDKPKEGEQGVRMKSGEIVSLIVVSIRRLRTTTAEDSSGIGDERTRLRGQDPRKPDVLQGDSTQSGLSLRVGCLVECLGKCWGECSSNTHPFAFLLFKGFLNYRVRCFATICHKVS